MNGWELHYNGSTGCDKWWELDEDDFYAEVMYCTADMHFMQPEIPLGWVQYSTHTEGWEPLPAHIETAEQATAYVYALYRLEGL